MSEAIETIYFAAFPPEGGPARGYGACQRGGLERQGAPGDVVIEITKAQHTAGGADYDAATGLFTFP